MTVVKTTGEIYNHQERHCVYCNRSIIFSDYMKAYMTNNFGSGNILLGMYRPIVMFNQLSNKEYDNLEQIWDSKYVELFCCLCYNTVGKRDNIEESIEDIYNFKIRIRKLYDK
ncbi:MAG: hypothetical protein ACFFG0_12285 [Candidatus Thorarchaeota archaeon]